MNFILISDLHMMGHTPVGRLDETIFTCYEKFEFILKYAKKHKACILQAGDFFDTPRNWFIMIAVMQLLKKYKVPVYTIFGQHDTYMYSEVNRPYTALGTVAESGLVTVLDNPLIVDMAPKPVHVYGCHYKSKAEIPKVIAKTAFNILVIHAPIAESKLYPGQGYFDNEWFLGKYPDYDVILCGDIHRSAFYLDEESQRCIINTGPMIRKDATEYNYTHEPHFYFMNEDYEFRTVTIPHLPAEQVLTRDHIEDDQKKNVMLDDFIEAVNEDDPEVGVELVKNINRFLKKKKIKKRINDILWEVMARHGDK